ncbi:hypothetical protein J22TS1_11960 [Siminovitchia terrae]|nr:hypothetical protein J22TS1_11960 [Siminovitchia terrae]
MAQLEERQTTPFGYCEHGAVKYSLKEEIELKFSLSINSPDTKTVGILKFFKKCQNAIS